MNRYVVLLRGINVGGKNIISMKDLKQCLETAGFKNVQTYIQSGNVLLSSKSKSIKRLTTKLESSLEDAFNYLAKVVVISKSDYLNALALVHKTWGQGESEKHNAMFAIGGADTQEILDDLPEIKKQIETVSCVPGVIFWSASKDQLSKSTMMKLSKTTNYKKLTVRNHKTTFKLAELLEQDELTDKV